MTSLNIITPLERNLKAAIHLQLVDRAQSIWSMQINLFYNGEASGSMSFNLNGYSQQEAEQIAHSIRTNEFLMKEIDDYLWGESD